MAKDKKGSKAVSAAPAPAASKPLETVKAGRVAKPVETVKAAAKDAAKKVAKEVEKKSKKAKKEPTPEPSSDEEDDTSDSSASSDDESNHTDDAGSDSSSSSDSDSGDEAFAKKAVLPKVNGATKAAADDDDDDTSSGSSSDGDEAPKVNGKARAAVDNDEGSDDDSGSSSGSSESDSDDEGVDVKAGAKKVKTNGVKTDDSDSSSASSDDEESDEEEVPKAAEPVKKRKAEDAFDQTPKKTKMVNVDGENKEAASNLFIGNLSWNVDEEWLTREFEEFGEITGVRVITDRDTGRSKGYGYVDFVQVDSAIKALEEKNGEMLDGRNIRIDFSLPRQPKTDNFTPQQRSTDRAQRYGDTPKEPSKTLFVGNVSFDADESMLSDIFQEYGTITAVRLPTDRETEQLKGYGYVDFTNVDEAKAAFEALQGADVAGRPIRLDYASQRSNDSPRGGFGSRGGFGGGRGAPRGRGGFSDRGGGRGGRGGFGDRGRGRGAPRGGRGGTTNRGGFGDFSGKKISF